jgi:hypothetical protein
MYKINKRRSLAAAAAVIVVTLLASATSHAQDPDKYEPTDAPPPLKLITEAARKRLTAVTEPKDRTKVALELMTERLNAATTRSNEADFEAVFAELGVFNAVMDDTLAFLARSARSEGGSANNYKRFEIGLRQFIPKIDVIRRNAPADRERYLRYLARNVRDARARAIEPLFSDSVLPNRPAAERNQ